jgi:Flp pilus assembly protein TadD
MHRFSLRTIAALCSCGAAAMPALADDDSTCSSRRGDDAVAACDRLITQNPNDAVPYNNRGKAYDEKWAHARAISDFDQAIRPIRTLGTPTSIAA